MKKHVFVGFLIFVLLCSACGAEKEPESKSTFTQIDGQAAFVCWQQFFDWTRCVI